MERFLISSSLVFCLLSSSLSCANAFVQTPLKHSFLPSKSSITLRRGAAYSKKASEEPKWTASRSNYNQTTSTTTSSSLEWITRGFDQATASDDQKEHPSATATATSTATSRPAVVVGPKRVLVYDTTLRDGTQGESISASADDKLKICRRLAAFDVDFIEAGWPGSNPKDAEFFRRARVELNWLERSKLAAFGSTRRKHLQRVADDTQVQALIDSEAPTICIVAKAHAWQVTDILRTELEENLNMIRETVDYLVSHGRNVMVDMEHFFDGYEMDAEYAIRCCEAAADAGASTLVLCDTNGGSMPWRVGQISKAVVNHFDRFVIVGIHCHNDCGMAVANSVSACQNGVGLVQGTINGIGERTGNADLCSIIPTLSLHLNSNMTCNSHLQELTKLSRYIDEILNRTPNSAAPYVGSSAFAHKGGLHVAAMERSPLSYQHIEPEKVGNEKRVLISELSGRQNIMGMIQEVGVDMGEKVSNERAVAVLNRVKELEAQGYTFEGAEASVHLMILHSTRGYCPPFQVLDYSVNVYDSNMDSASRIMRDKTAAKSFGPTARATVNIRTMMPSNEDDLENGVVFEDPNELPYHDRLEVSDGNGPVDALANAMMRALQPVHPSLKSVELVDYKVRILDPESATGAATRVLIEFRDSIRETTWTTVSVDTNVISASLNALIDGFEYALIEHANSCMLCDDDFF